MPNIKLELMPFKVPDTVEVAQLKGVTKEGKTTIHYQKLLQML